jgi:hypothetical protein
VIAAGHERLREIAEDAPPNAMPIPWWPRQTPSRGTLGPKRRMTSTEIPASSGRPGPGEMTMCVGCRPAISSRVISSFRRTSGGAPSSPKYWARFQVNES